MFVLVDWFPVVESVLIVVISIVVVSGELVAIAAVVVEVDVVSLVVVLSLASSVISRGVLRAFFR